MAERINLKDIEKDFSCFKDSILGILLFGSKANGTHNKRSDVDVCLIAGGKNNADKLFGDILKTNLTGKYDIKIFELLPLKLKGSILENHRIVWAKDRNELDYYLYKTGRIWNDQKTSLKKLGLEMYR